MLASSGFALPAAQAWPQYCARQVYDKPSSRNWPTVAAAAWYYADPGRAIDGRTPAQWWLDWSGWQLGGKSGPHLVRKSAEAADWWARWNADAAHRDAAPAALQIFGSDEVLSSTYDGMTIGAAIAALLAARKHGDADTEVALSAALAVWVAVTALAATAPSTEIKVYNLAGPSFPKVPDNMNVPAVLGIGARSTPNHAAADPRALLLADLIEWPDARHPWPAREPFNYWFLHFSALCNGDYGLAPELTADARAAVAADDPAALDRLAASLEGTRWAGFEIRRWPGLAAGIMAEARNFNTAWVPASVARPNGLIELWFPWPKAKPGNLSSGKASIDGTGSIQVVSGFGTLPGLQLPAEPPLRHWIFDPDGFRPAGEPTPGIPKAPETPKDPGHTDQDPPKKPIDVPPVAAPTLEERVKTLEDEVRALRAAVAALQAQR